MVQDCIDLALERFEDLDADQVFKIILGNIVGSYLKMCMCVCEGGGL